MDQAFHLAGFAPECVRKAILASSWVFKPLGHALGDDADLILDLFTLLEPGVLRYNLSGWAARFPELSRWRPDVRYEATGTRTEERARAIVSESRDLTIGLLAALWADGRLNQENFGW